MKHQWQVFGLIFIVVIITQIQYFRDTVVRQHLHGITVWLRRPIYSIVDTIKILHFLAKACAPPTATIFP